MVESVIFVMSYWADLSLMGALHAVAVRFFVTIQELALAFVEC